MIELYPISSPQLFFGVEIRPVTLYRDVDGSEYYDEPTAGYPPSMWSVFGLYDKRSGHFGCDCIGDFETEQQASQYAELLASVYDWPIYFG